MNDSELRTGAVAVCSYSDCPGVRSSFSSFARCDKLRACYGLRCPKKPAFNGRYAPVSKYSKMPAITYDAIASNLLAYGLAATPALCLAIQKYISVLLRWNEKIALTTITDPLDIVRFHFGESMFGASAVPINEGRLADVGAGAGFPGLPLKMLLPSLYVVLIESNAKKASFLSECIRELDLSGVEVHRGRFEEIKAAEHRFDFVTARALGGYSDLVTWSQRQLTPRGALVMWLGERDAVEIRKASSFNWRGTVPITGSDRRVLLIGTHA